MALRFCELSKMTEDFLHYIWKFRLFNTAILKTSTGEELQILHPGTHNTNGGPDFLQAKIKIGNQIWVGNVEIHIRAGDWHRHTHTDDIHYKNVILHVVFENDKEVYLHKPGDLPVFEMAGYMLHSQWASYQRWMSSKTWIPCQNELHRVDHLTWTAWKDSLLAERLEEKSTRILAIHQKTGSNWSETLYRLMARNFGFKVNADAMEMLAESLPQTLLARHKSDPFQIEALLFGQSGLLHAAKHTGYGLELKQEYDFLSTKYGLKPMSVASWNFFRMRPSNFPTIRIAQFAALICGSEHLFSKLISHADVHELKSLFRVSAHPYWQNHFRFEVQDPQLKIEATDFTVDAQEKKKMGRLGESSLENIIINTVSPVLFAYGRLMGNETLTERALKLTESCRAEENAIIRKWTEMNVTCSHAGDAQSLLQLYNQYCQAKRCLQCRIGLKLLRE